MKTIITTLPIYDKLSKQCFERGKHAGGDTPTPIVCPRHRLPSFQWLDGTDGAASISNIELIDAIAVDSMVLITDWPGATYTIFTHVGANITQAQTAAAGIHLVRSLMVPVGGSASWSASVGQSVTFSYNLTLTSGATPYVYIVDTISTAVISNVVNLIAGANVATLTITTECIQTGRFVVEANGPTDFALSGVSGAYIDNVSIMTYFPVAPTLAHDYFTYNGTTLNHLLPIGLYYLKITTNNAKVYYSEWFQVDCVFGTDTGLPPTATYSTKYLILNFHNDCDMGDIYYHGGFTQTIWMVSEAMEPSFPTEEEGVKNGEGQFIRTFARQVKKYLLRSPAMPDYMVDVFNRMRLCDSIQLIDLVGDTHDVYNLEVEHEWLGTDKYYAKLDLTFDYNEAVVIAGCCNNIT